LQKNAADLLLMLKDGIEKGTQVAGEQLPDLAYQYVMYGRVTLTFGVLCGIAMLAFTVYYANRIAKRAEDEGQDHVLVWIAAAISLTIFGVPTTVALPEFFMVWFAPKIWLLQEIAKVLK